MSFEILSLIEDESLKGTEITTAIVDSVINDFYLTNFKNPPIDHIRDLIKHNTEVRKALIKLKNGKIDELTDDDINRFYLFGITSTKVNKQNIKIKNKVIELSLSDQWLENIELEKQGYYEYGNEKIKQGKIEEGVSLLKEYLQNEPNGTYSEWAKYDIGTAYYNIGKNLLSNQYLLECKINKTNIISFYELKFYIGVNYLKTKEYENAKTYFEDVLDNFTLYNLIIPSKINVLEIQLINSDLNKEDFEPQYLELLELFEKNNDTIIDLNYYYKIIYYRLGFVTQYKNEKSLKSLEYFKNALEYAKVDDKPILLLNISEKLKRNPEEQILIYKEIVNLIIENKLKFVNLENIIPLLNEYILFFILVNLFELKLNYEFDKLFIYSIEVLYNCTNKEPELLFNLGGFAINNSKTEIGEDLLRKVIQISEIPNNKTKNCHLFLGILAQNKKDDSLTSKYFQKYIELFRDYNNFNEPLSNLDFTAFSSLIEYKRKKLDYKGSFEVATIIKNYTNDKELSIEEKASISIIYFYIMDYYNFIGDINNSINYGEKLLLIISELKPVISELSYVDKKGLENIEQQTLQSLRRFKGVTQIEPIKIVRVPGRNEYVTVKYKNGKEMTTKYKKVIEDIRNNECFLVDYN